MALTLAQIDDQITALQQAKSKRLVDGVVTRTAFQGGSSEKQVASLEEINGEIARLEVLRSQLTGQPSGGGPIHIGFGGRT